MGTRRPNNQPTDQPEEEDPESAADTGEDGDDATAEDDTADEVEEIGDPIAKAVADAEARMRHRYIKPLKAELAQLKQNAGNTEAVVDVVRTLRMENKFLRLAGGTFHDSEAAFKLADLSQVEIGKDGRLTGMEAVIDQLMESHPYLVRDDTDTDYTPGGDAPDLPSGRPMNGKQKTSDPATGDAELYKRYPALRRRRGW